MNEDGDQELIQDERDGTWHETEYGQTMRWIRQAPDLYELYLKQTERIAEAKRMLRVLELAIRQDNGSEAWAATAVQIRGDL